MFKNSEDKFINEALEIVRKKLLRMGIVCLYQCQVEEWRSDLLKIGERYHEIKEQEGL